MPQTTLNPVHAHERADRLAARLSALYEVLQAIATSMEVDQLLRLILDKACSLLGVDRCALYLVEERTAEGILLRCRHARGLPLEEFERVRLGPNEGITTHVLAGVKTLWTDDILADARYPLGQGMRALLAAHDIRGILCAPVVVRRQILGLIYLYPEAGLGFAPDEADLLSALALQAGIALESARLLAAEGVEAPQSVALRLDTAYPSD